MKTATTNLVLSALFGVLGSLPFLIMELANRHGYSEAIPYRLYGILWFLAAAFLYVLLPLIRRTIASSGSVGLLSIIRCVS